MPLKIKLRKCIDDTYPIYIQPGIFEALPEVLKESGIGKRFAIITDSRVKNLYGLDFLKACKKAKLDCEMFYFASGESAKKFSTVTKLLDNMAQMGFHRDSAIIALGGGVTGDIAGMVAALYMRGIPYVQIPTTMMSMADSSIGGKTGVNSIYGKNLYGIFYQPKAVFIDTEFLNTLPKRDFLNGVVEMIKHGIILDPGLFRRIEKRYQKLLDLDRKFLNKIILRSCKVKKEVVEHDELEEGPRMILNFGHTVGHALEKISGFRMMHGEALAIGIVAESRIAFKRGLLKEKVFNRIKKLFETLGFVTEITEKGVKRQVANLIQMDKKVRGGKVHFILPKKLGKVIIADDVLTNEILNI